MSQVLISAVTVAELPFGVARKREAVRLITAIDGFLLLKIRDWTEQKRLRPCRYRELHSPPSMVAVVAISTQLKLPS